MVMLLPSLVWLALFQRLLFLSRFFVPITILLFVNDRNYSERAFSP
jgi:hypothetical protein